jgi:histidinol-phosphate aminotransferase
MIESDAGVRLRFHRNECALGPPGHVLDAVRGIDAESLRTYPAELQSAFVRGLANRIRVQPETVAVGNGADELLLALGRAFLAPGDNVVAMTPTFGMYAQMAAMSRAHTNGVRYERRWSIDPERIASRADARTKLIVVGHPNNPTGDSAPASAVEFLANEVPGATIVVDEVYLAFSPSSLVTLASTYPNVAVVGSLSKVAGLAGMRVGYAVASADVADALRSAIVPFPLSAASLIAANAYVNGGPASRAYDVALYAQVQRSLDAIVAGIGVYARACWRGAGNFVLMDFGDSGARIVTALAARGIAVRTFADPELSGAIRFCAANDEATDELIRTTRAVLQEQKRA